MLNMTDNTLPPFSRGIQEIGLAIGDLRLEGFRTDGTSNYLANLNFRGQTWAAALRLPAKGADVHEFVSEKKHALVAVDYLLQVLHSDVEVSNNCVLAFRGVSCLVEGKSVQDFLCQSGLGQLVLIDNVLGREKSIIGVTYPDCISEDVREYVRNYGGPFYLSRGAPAWETLEEYPDFEPQVAHAIAALHLLTGSGTPVPLTVAQAILSETQLVLNRAADRWTPEPGSKEEAALVKSLKKWNPSQDPKKVVFIRRERFMRTRDGKAVCHKIFSEMVRQHPLKENVLRSFRHGDCHGGNFIIVRYMYTLTNPAILLDRVFLNEIFDARPLVDRVHVTIDNQSQRIVFDVRESTGFSVTAERKPHSEIHIIDLDAGQGSETNTKQVHLYDALIYAMSLENLTTLFAHPIVSKEILGHYYDGLNRGNV